MGDLTALIEAQELEVDCWHCGWQGRRTVSWIDAHRDMNCPACERVIVLNTSERRREIAALRRQVSALHSQLLSSLSTAIRPVAAKPPMNLGLFDRYGENGRTVPEGGAVPKRAARSRR